MRPSTCAWCAGKRRSPSTRPVTANGSVKRVSWLPTCPGWSWPAPPGTGWECPTSRAPAPKRPRASSNEHRGRPASPRAGARPFAAGAHASQIRRVALRGKVKNSLDEARMLMLGAQVLLGFQYRAFFEEGYEKLGPAERALEIAALFALLLTLLLLFLPPARHRIVEHGRDTARFHRFVMTVMGVALLPFALGLSFELVFYAAWFGAMLLLRRRRSGELRTRPA